MKISSLIGCCLGRRYPTRLFMADLGLTELSQAGVDLRELNCSCCFSCHFPSQEFYFQLCDLPEIQRKVKVAEMWVISPWKSFSHPGTLLDKEVTGVTRSRELSIIDRDSSIMMTIFPYQGTITGSAKRRVLAPKKSIIRKPGFQMAALLQFPDKK